MAILNAIGTVLAFVTFIGIVFWAFSRGRKKDNDEAAMLPFALPDEGEAGDEQDAAAEGTTKRDEEGLK
jgi:cytochrome c oxidase cbb3-type subunit 4